MKFTLVDKEVCIACGTCREIAPEIFVEDAKGNSHVILDNNEGTAEVPEELYDDLYDAYDECPSGAITIADQPF